MSDLKDILGVSRTPAAEGERPKKEKQERMKRPEGMSREAFALLGDNHPIMPSQLLSGLKKKKDDKGKARAVTKGQPTYFIQAFTNEARADGLQLRHWVKGYKDASGRVRLAEEYEGEYKYVKYNKKVPMMLYNDEEYGALVKDDPAGGWTRPETDYLLALAQQLDLKWTVIADRYSGGGQPRSMEDLKERYYFVQRRLLVAREGGEAAVANHPLVKHPYNAEHERNRKAALNALLGRTPQQEAEDAAILEEARAIEERRAKELGAQPTPAARRPGGGPGGAAKTPGAASPAGGAGAGSSMAVTSADFKFPAEYPNDVVPSLFSAAGVQPIRPTKGNLGGAGPYLRGVHMREASNEHTNVLNKAQQKGLEGAWAEVGMAPATSSHYPKVFTRATCGSWLALREELLELVELRRLAASRQPGSKKRPGEGGGGRSDKRPRTQKKFE